MFGKLFSGDNLWIIIIAVVVIILLFNDKDDCCLPEPPCPCPPKIC